MTVNVMLKSTFKTNQLTFISLSANAPKIQRIDIETGSAN